MGSDLGPKRRGPNCARILSAGPVEKIVPNLRPPALKDAMEVTVEHLGAVQFEVNAREHTISCDQPPAG